MLASSVGLPVALVCHHRGRDSSLRPGWNGARRLRGTGGPGGSPVPVLGGRGYPELKNAADNSNADDLQGCLAHDMGGPPVTFGMAESGVEKHANTSHHDSGHFTYNCTYHFDAISALSKDGVKNTWTGYKRELAGSRPPIVYSDTTMPLPDIRYHWMAGTGYWEDTAGTRLVYVNDSHGEEDRSLDYNSYSGYLAWLYVYPGN